MQCYPVLIGNVKEIIAQATANQDQYMFEFDRLSQYMFNNNVPQETVDRVKQWCQHTWKTQKSFNELGILEFLPIKMRTDLALDVHYKVILFSFSLCKYEKLKKISFFFQTISKVKLFHGCDPGLIKSLVIKLQPMLFLPGDYICKKGDDIGKEICIVY